MTIATLQPRSGLKAENSEKFIISVGEKRAAIAKPRYTSCRRLWSRVQCWLIPRHATTLAKKENEWYDVVCLQPEYTAKLFLCARPTRPHTHSRHRTTCLPADRTGSSLTYSGPIRSLGAATVGLIVGAVNRRSISTLVHPSILSAMQLCEVQSVNITDDWSRQ